MGKFYKIMMSIDSKKINKMNKWKSKLWNINKLKMIFRKIKFKKLEREGKDKRVVVIIGKWVVICICLVDY